jgi:hypothetical protein
MTGLLLVVISTGGDKCVVGKRKGGRLPHVKMSDMLLVARGLHLDVVRLLATFRDAWCCLAISSAVRDNVKDGACGNVIQCGLALQQTTMGFSARVKPPGVVRG